MMKDSNNKIKKSLFIETFAVLKDINDTKLINYSSSTKTANDYNLRNKLEYIGLKLNKYSILLKTQKTAKPAKLPIAGS